MPTSSFEYTDPCESLDDNEYLQQFKLSDRKFAIGTFQEGITVYKQQIRALNIFHALVNTGRIPTDSNWNFKIVIVGGGIAGLTFATAALKSKVRVVMVERHSHYLHMQRGCTIRKLHPHLYDWPIPGSTNIHAKLPVLSWKYDTAANVVNQVEYGFRQIIKDVNKAGAPQYFAEHFNVQKLKMHDEDLLGRRQFHVTGESPDLRVNAYVDLVIYAVGFGIELGVRSKYSTPSYWRNESFHQSFLDLTKTKFHVVGTGDGALIDLFRLLVRDFSYDLVFYIFSQNPFQNELEEILLNIKKIIYEGKVVTTLDHQFSEIDPKKYEFIYGYLFEKDLFRRYVVELNGRKDDFSNILDLNKISMLNAFLAYILEQRRKFEYVKRKVELSEENVYLIDENPVPDTDIVIDRRGTQRKAAYAEGALSDKEVLELEEIEKLQKSIHNNGIVKPRWTYTELCKHFDPELEYDVEYLTSDTRSICSGFVSVLYKILQSTHNSEDDFRVTLYRVMDSPKGMRFQQITSYFGTKKYTASGGVGNAFDIKRGNVGLTITTGRPILIRRSDEDCFKSALAELNMLDEYGKLDGLNSFLTIPILAHVDKGFATNLVVSIDSKKVDFFDSGNSADKLERNEIFNTIISATSGFIDNIDHLLAHSQIKMEQSAFPIEPIDESSSALGGSECMMDISTVYSELNPSDTILKFQKFNSFDIVYGNIFSFN